MSEISEEKETQETQETINIVVLCDGTFNGPTTETNLYKLHILLLYDKYCKNQSKEKQVPLKISDYKWLKSLKKQNKEPHNTREIADGAFVYEDQYYEKGVAERFNPLDFAIAHSIDSKIKRAYRHIVRRRGAYTVRCVAGMIRNCGILKYDSKELINRAYDLYRSKDPKHHPNEPESKSFQDSFSHQDSTKIKFLGLWDTVGAYGIPSFTVGKGIEYTEFHDENVSKMTEYAYQVLGIHEKSSFFEPISIKNEKNECEECEKNEKCEECKKCKDIEEIWFPGDHLEIGGATLSVDKEISKESFLWIIRKIIRVGGLFSEEKEEEKIKECEKRIKEIPKDHFRSLMQYVHYLVPAYHIKRATTIVPFWGRNRTIPIRRDDNGKLTFDLLYEKDILIEELKGKYGKDNDDRTDEKDSDDEIEKILDIKANVNTKSFDAKTISEFNRESHDDRFYGIASHATLLLCCMTNYLYEKGKMEVFTYIDWIARIETFKNNPTVMRFIVEKARIANIWRNGRWIGLRI
ncbi:4378_t:CDS:2 [Diversispora eburnea]|uniref:4378_t:CDS:1 n=1 Tax=Diversispora eburnea TaxID=1213867 RepID=A0A9N8V445_9GLOM|nr:4378_t:CDS:2 [Diversispora eburnea]